LWHIILCGLRVALKNGHSVMFNDF
jgi:hypothetical protein